MKSRQQKPEQDDPRWIQLSKLTDEESSVFEKHSKWLSLFFMPLRKIKPVEAVQKSGGKDRT